MTALLDPSTEAFLTDPHKTFDALRAQPGLVRDPLGWSAISYNGCNDAFLDTALVPGIDPLLTELGFGPLWGVADQTLTDSEGQAHQRLRRAVAPWFTPRRINALRERTRALARQRLQVRSPTEPISFTEDIGDVIPARLFCWMIGVSDSDAQLLASWSKALLLVFTARKSMVEPVRAAKLELAEYTHALLKLKRESPGDDLASELAAAAMAGAISAQDAYLLLEELLSASVDNTANTAGLAVHTLAQDRHMWSDLHHNPDLLASAVEECGRFQPAIRHTIKYAVKPTELEGTAIAAGDYVTLRVAAAHRDPSVYADPHQFDIRRRQPRPQLAFGAGRHYCLGAALAKMEVQEMVGAVTAWWPSAEVAPGAKLSIAASGHVHNLPLRPTS